MSVPGIRRSVALFISRPPTFFSPVTSSLRLSPAVKPQFIQTRASIRNYAKMASPQIKLNNGKQMPLVGFGLWKVNNDTCADQVYNAIKTGYRLFDGACDYGNEKEAGEGVARAIKDGLVKREDLFIVSKLWNSFHDKERVAPITEKQLKDWGIDYFDLFIIHFPIALKYVDPSVRYPPGFFDENDKLSLSKAPLEETYHEMEKLYERGLIKAIGISNYNGSLLLDVERYAKIMPQTLQIEHHPYLVQQDLLDLCKSREIAVTAYSSFGPQSFLELNMQKAKDTPLLFDHNDIKSIADKHNKSPAQILLRWATQRGIAVIPKSNNQSRLAQNLDVCSFDLSDAEIKQISALDKGLRFNNPLNYGVPVPIFA
ncbi:putative NAD(P)H-dependent D-xylose reductase xyl1 [Pseudocercospora fuligena]|uniref:Putative NAD(P)H-dependent D-xylose reductase xyl1 n=1 Tax=Pseudocercospora fuligena TaxID=685502 RepID=A0A8H6VDZ3_9PEZI|nr:putative NAD(P)H-dependent D-xylose reductase xyl1 [Pseudocercospora fuligena]